ncbi:MAG TPA: UDP-N-acetylmuramoyl-tripeptide--D-alanyl-D-alanine ligase [Steroidobacteraceae bacterium]|nr:UDP-N-acetylmuramoyl-tripeptide--D-alanyl-D-alanine ligase [Steroidobacteraceae bacterium]
MKRTLAQFAAACGGQLIGADAPFAEVLIDSRAVQAGDLFVALPGVNADGHDFVAKAAQSGAVGAVVSRRVAAPLPQVLVPDVAAALTAAGAAWRAAYAGTVLGVAGSNGKTTTKEMLGAILAQRGQCLATRGNLNNHLGVPLTLLRLAEHFRDAVIEIGANHAGEVAALVALARPAVGLITNAGAEHLEGFGSVEGVARAEGEMVAGLAADAVAVINADDEFAPLWRGMTKARIVDFGFAASAAVRAADVRLEATAQGFATRFTLHSAAGAVPVELALAGRHNISNALAAAAAALAAGATLPQVAAGLRTVQAVAGRLQFKPLAGGAWLIDDSYNANPSSARAALEVLAELPGTRWLVLGDMAELGEHAAESHRQIGALARELGIERLYAFGPLAALAAERFGAGAERHGDIDALARSIGGALHGQVRLLVKGSRVNRLERLVAALANAGGAAAGATKRRAV